MAVAIEIEYASVVVIGAWNPAIINPAWLIQQGLVAQEKEVKVAFQPLRRSFIFALGGLEWKVEEDRLEIRTKGGQDPGGWAAEILKLLPHTPVRAVGSNLAFKSSLGEWDPGLLPRLGGFELPTSRDSTDFRMVAWRLVRDIAPDTRVRVELTQDFETVGISFNFHRNCQHASEAAGHAGAFAKDRDVAVQLMKDMFQKEFLWPK